MSKLSATLHDAADHIEGLEKELENARQEATELRDEVARLEDRVGGRVLEQADAQEAEDVYDLIADVRRGIVDLDELYDRTVG
jgi:septal ring factor EnvC (AmiA/AmiB activator)